MASEFFIVVTPGGMKLQRRHKRDVPPGGWGENWSGGTNAGTPGLGRPGRPVTGFSQKARRQMRWVWNALPWEDVPRLTMLTLTYPGDWRQCCADGETLKRHLRAFRERWRRRWGGARGTWTLEFQPRPTRPLAQQLAPHLHLYVGLPEGATLTTDVTDERLVWDWAREAWHEIVGSKDPNHRFWGVHVRPCFYGSYGDGRENGKRVGDYLWRESGKLAQKEAPDGFDGVKWWAVWGLKPVEHELQIPFAEYVELRRPVKLLRDKKTHAKVRRPSGLDGLSVTNVDGIAVGPRLVRWAEREVEDAAAGREVAQPLSERAVRRRAERDERYRERATEILMQEMEDEERARDAWVDLVVAEREGRGSSEVHVSAPDEEADGGDWSERLGTEQRSGASSAASEAGADDWRRGGPSRSW